jgi:hypothetical protein
VNYGIREDPEAFRQGQLRHMQQISFHHEKQNICQQPKHHLLLDFSQWRANYAQTC